MKQPEHSATAAAPNGRRSPLPGIDIFSACPVSVGSPGRAYLEQVRDVARWSERHGYRGILVYADNRLIDPWLVSQIIVQNTRALSPLVAVQPAYMHPYSVAKMIATFAGLYRRRLFINWVAGGFKNDLEALADTTPHDARYDRLVEYATIVRRLTDGGSVTFRGSYYEVEKLTLRPSVDETLRPVYMLSGSSDAGQAAARILAARPVTYALPSERDQSPPGQGAPMPGLRIGIIARPQRADAWRTAYERFPTDRSGALMRDLARKVSDSKWHEKLCREADERGGDDDVYWMVPFSHYRSMCPYLVGSHEEVAEELGRYLARGFQTFIVDQPETEDDLLHAKRAFDLARGRTAVAA